MIKVIFLLTEKKYISLKSINFQPQFCLGNISNGFAAVKSKEAFLNGNVYDFSVR